MEHLKLKVKLIGGQLPECRDVTNAGFDLFASEDHVVLSGQRGIVPLGITTEFSPQYVALIKDRSGVAITGRYSHAGVIDSSYRGEWKVVFSNEGNDWHIEKGDRIAQVLFLPIFHLIVETVDSLQESTRGASGFGSSGH